MKKFMKIILIILGVIVALIIIFILKVDETPTSIGGE